MLFYTRTDLDEKEQVQSIEEQIASEMESLNINSKESTSSTSVSCNEKNLEAPRKPDVIIKDAVKTNGDGKPIFVRNTGSKNTKIPLPIEKSIQKQNVRFLHHRNQYSPEFFQVRTTKNVIARLQADTPFLFLSSLFLVYEKDHQLQHQPHYPAVQQ